MQADSNNPKAGNSMLSAFFVAFLIQSAMTCGKCGNKIVFIAQRATE